MKKTKNNFLKLCLVLGAVVVLVGCGCEETQINLNEPGKENTTTYTVTFEENGGSAVSSQSVAKGKKAIKPNDPINSTNSSYVFAGWYQDKGLTQLFDFNTAITNNTTLYAKWRLGTGSGPAFRFTRGIAFHNGAAYVTDEGLAAVVRVDLNNGNRTIISKSGTRGSGPAISHPYDIAFHGGAAYVVDLSLAAVVRVDLTTGDRTIFSKSGTRGSGPAFLTLLSIAVHSGAAYVTDGLKGISDGLDAVVQVDLTTGDRTIISKSGTRGNGPAFISPAGIAFYNGAAYVTDASLSAVVQVDLATGNRNIISKQSRYKPELNRGSGPAFNTPDGIAFHSGAAYVADFNLRAVVRVELNNGNRTIVSKSGTRGSGPAFSPDGIAVHNGAAYVAILAGEVVKVDLATGNRNIISKQSRYKPELNRGSGPAFNTPDGIAFHSGAAYVADFNLRAVVRVELNNGNRTIVSKSGTRGSGPAFSPDGIAVHNGAAYVAILAGEVVKVDLATGNRTIFSK